MIRRCTSRVYFPFPKASPRVRSHRLDWRRSLLSGKGVSVDPGVMTPVHRASTTGSTCAMLFSSFSDASFKPLAVSQMAEMHDPSSRCQFFTPANIPP